MVCTATGPINIVHTDSRCLNKCRFNYEFKKTQVIAKNKGSYVSIELANKDNIVAEYSSSNTPLCANGGNSKLSIEELRIYNPSLHTYGKNKKHTDAELIIILNNATGGRRLVICIPISTINGTLPTASDNLTSIISYLGRMGNKVNEGGNVKGLNFDLNGFIPKKGYYSYTASLPWDPCQKCTDYIVYDMKDSIISLSNITMSLLGKIITNSNISTSNIETNKVGFSYNKRGAIRGFGNNNNKIWINCYPTGSDGKILMEESKNGVLSNNAFGMFSGISQEKYERYKMLAWTVAGTILAVLALLFCMTKLYTIIFGGQQDVKQLKGSLKISSNTKS